MVTILARWLVWYWLKNSSPNWHERNATGTARQRKERLTPSADAIDEPVERAATLLAALFLFFARMPVGVFSPILL